MPDIEMIPVSSSNVESIGYDPATETLRVRFNSGSTYEYKNVPVAEFEALRLAPSIGSYLNRNIKTSYPVEKVG